jgi:hypothetical protein
MCRLHVQAEMLTNDFAIAWFERRVRIREWMTPQERVVFRRHFGYAADVMMNAIMRGQQFAIEQEQVQEPPELGEESIAVMGNVVQQALAEAELRAAIADAE